MSGYKLVRGRELERKVEADPVMSAYAKARREGKTPEEADEIAMEVWRRLKRESEDVQ